MTFKQELLLMILDKLVITAIVGLALMWLQKKLEAFKERQSLDTEITKQRVASISKGWKALNAWDLAVSDIICEFARIIREQDPELKPDAGLDELGLPKLTEIVDWLAKLKNSSALVQIRQQCDRELSKFLEKSDEESKKARLIMQENRFWFGKDLYEHCLRFHAALHGVCTAFGDQDFDKLKSQLLKLDEQRQDVLMTLQGIRTLPHRETQEQSVAVAS
jgi:hypothetical protein